MNDFVTLYYRLDRSGGKTLEKVRAIREFFSAASGPDKLWALALFTGRKGRRPISTRQLRTWCTEWSGLPDWLFEESYQAVGDLAETLARLKPPPGRTPDGVSLTGWMSGIRSLSDFSEEEKKEWLRSRWDEMDAETSLVFHKLLTGGFRVGASAALVLRGLGDALGMDPLQLSHRIMGNWDPEKTTFEDLICSPMEADDWSRPYPFCLAHPLAELPGEQPSDWCAEWKWDGIRGQILVRNGEVYIWSRGEELVTGQFPELAHPARLLPAGSVWDGEILAEKDGEIQSFSVLQSRIGRKKLRKKDLEDSPVVFRAYDLLEWEGRDIRQLPFRERRQILEHALGASPLPGFGVSPLLEFGSWEELATLRAKAADIRAEGVMLKRAASTYGAGRRRGDWWKWKQDPFQIEGVLLYAQKGHGRRAGLFTDYTLGVWDGERLLPFAKAYSGLSDAEIREVDAFIKKNTLEKFGPVRTVKPQLVFEIHFEGIQLSTRHNSGLALRCPRIGRWRRDKPAREAGTLEELKGFLGKA